MKYYFEDKKNQERLKKILDEWLGTPFRHRTGVKGQGADCIHFVAKVYDEMDIIEFALSDVPDYSPDWHLHNTRQKLFEKIISTVPVEQVPIDNLMNGDLVLSHFGKAASHTSVFFDGYLYHAITNIGVIKEEINNSVVTGKLKFALRLLNE